MFKTFSTPRPVAEPAGLSRRDFVSLGATATGLAAAAALTKAQSGVAQAQAPSEAADLNGASFYRFALGTKTLTILADGSALFPGAELFAVNIDPAEFAQTQERLFEPAANTNFHMNTLLIEEGDRKIVVDAGAGHFFGDAFGRQALALRNAGVDPADIDTVVITHGHPDHFGGLLTRDLTSAFANAQIVWDGREYDYWTSEAAVSALRGSQIPEDFVSGFISTSQTVLPAIAPQIERVNLGEAGEIDVAPGVTLIAAPGHTPHSLVVLVSSGDEQLLHASDTTLLPAQNAANPDWVSAFELDPTNVVPTRRRLLDRASADGITWFGYHAPFPALSRVRASGDAYEYVPVSWTWS